MFRNSRLASTILLAMGFAGAAVSSAIDTAKNAIANAPTRRSTAQTGGSGWRGTRRGPGWSNRHVHRMARKRKNQARHKAHCRRQRGFITLEIMVWMAAAIAVWSIALGLVMESRRVTSSNHRETVRCVDGSLSKVTNSGMATPVLDRTGKTIACPLT